MLHFHNVEYPYAFTCTVPYTFALRNAFTGPNTSSPHNAFGSNVIANLSLYPHGHLH